MGVDGQKGIQSAFEGSTNQRFSPAQQALDQQLKGTAQFAILQDAGGTGHGKTDNGPEVSEFNSLTFLANPQTATVLAQNGFKNLAMEIRREFQPLADKVARGEMTPAQFAQGKADMYRAAGEVDASTPSARSVEEGKVIQNMGRAGIRVLCKENLSANLKAHGEAVDKMGVALERYSNISAENLQLADIPKSWVGALKQKISDSTNGTVFGDIAQERQRHHDDVRIEAVQNSPRARSIAYQMKQNMEDVIKGDVALAASIKKDVGKEKTAVYYGNSHGAYAYDLDEALGKDTKKIGLYVSENSAKATVQNAYAENMQQPHGIIALDTGKSFSAADIEKWIDKTAPRMPAEFTPALTKH